MNAISIVATLLFVGLVTLFWIRKWPIVQGLVIANFAVFVLMLVTGNLVSIRGTPLLDDLALRPSYVLDPQPLKLYTALTSTFLHADVAHIIGNMLVFLMIGLPFEERVGRWRLLVIYGGSAIVGVLLHSWYNASLGAPVLLELPLVGASGAVFGILGAFAASYPRDRIPMFLIFIFLQRVPVIIGALIMTLVEGVFLFAGGQYGGVARAAHIGGAVGGVILGLALKPRSGPAAANRPSRINYATLDRLAVDSKQRELVDRLRMNEGNPDLQAPWIEKIAATLRCPMCGQSYTAQRRSVLRCANGHEERYAE